MAVIDSPTTTDVATIDATSKALRFISYGENNNPLIYKPAGVYSNAFNFTAVTATANEYLFALNNPGNSGVTIYIKEIYMETLFHGTTAASAWQIQVVKFIGNFSNSAVNIGKFDSSYATPGGFITQDNAGSTIPANVFELGILAEMNQPRSAGGVQRLSMKYANPAHGNTLDILPNEGIGFKMITATVSGDYLTGYVIWEEL